ncbi:MAG: histidine triad nucleotide-binding protein [Deltaproteobacteria bacterium]|nr:histidine triad nucleotide-binding protein [Deltaproteobacteria bacterium]
MGACIFCEIASGRTETRVIFDDGDVLAFPDVHPQAPVHLLLIPRIHIPNTLALAPLHDQLVGKLVRIAAQLATDKAVAADGYRLLTNTNAQAGQSVYHLHFHLLAGRALGWPPG